MYAGAAMKSLYGLLLIWNHCLGYEQKEVLKFGVARCDQNEQNETENYVKVKTTKITTDYFSSCFRLSPRYTENINLFGTVEEHSNLSFWFYPDGNYGFIQLGGFVTMFNLIDRGFR